MKKIRDIDPEILARIFRKEVPPIVESKGLADHLTPFENAVIEKAFEEGTCIDIFPPRKKADNS